MKKLIKNISLNNKNTEISLSNTQIEHLDLSDVIFDIKNVENVTLRNVSVKNSVFNIDNIENVQNLLISGIFKDSKVIINGKERNIEGRLQSALNFHLE